jgi:hypothetical protein
VHAQIARLEGELVGKQEALIEARAGADRQRSRSRVASSASPPSIGQKKQRIGRRRQVTAPNLSYPTAAREEITRD